MSETSKPSSGVSLEPFAELTVPSSPEFLALLRSHVAWFCQRCGFESSVTSRIVLSVVEAATNVMRHAYSGEPEDTITLRCTEFSSDPKSPDPKSPDPKNSDPKNSDSKASDSKSSDPKSSDSKASDSKALNSESRGGVRIEILDRGQHASANECQGREPGCLEPGGLGVHVITSCMDRVERERREGGGTRLVLTKYFVDSNTIENEPSAPARSDLSDD